LRYSIGESTLLFKASDAPWAKSIRIKDGHECFVTDGPYLCKAEDGKLIMLWSSFTASNNYAIVIAKSITGDVLGPWSQEDMPLFADNGGHSMLFKTFSGQLMLALHAPNMRGSERPVFINIKESNGTVNLS